MFNANSVPTPDELRRRCDTESPFRNNTVEGGHLLPETLARVRSGGRPDPAEVKHLNECSMCRGRLKDAINFRSAGAVGGPFDSSHGPLIDASALGAAQLEAGGSCGGGDVLWNTPHWTADLVLSRDGKMSMHLMCFESSIIQRMGLAMFVRVSLLLQPRRFSAIGWLVTGHQDPFVSGRVDLSGLDFDLLRDDVLVVDVIDDPKSIDLYDGAAAADFTLAPVDVADDKRVPATLSAL